MSTVQRGPGQSLSQVQEGPPRGLGDTQVAVPKPSVQPLSWLGSLVAQSIGSKPWAESGSDSGRRLDLGQPAHQSTSRSVSSPVMSRLPPRVVRTE